MAQCANTINLEVHHKNINGGNDILNAEVLCQICHQNTASYGVAGRESPPPFDETTRQLAFSRANFICECTRSCPHHLS